MSGRVRDRIILAVCTVLAVLLAVDISNGEWLWIALACAGASVLIFTRLVGTHFASSCLLLVWIGYWLGNRGFAQLSPISSLPLFPGELVLLVLSAVLIWQVARRRQWPWVAGPGEWVVALWLGVGLARFVPSFMEYKIEAIRDFAMVYYGAFFFFAHLAHQEAPLAERFDRALRFSTALLIPCYFLFRLVPEFFTDHLIFRGNPLVYYKDDLVGTYLAAGAVAHFLHAQRKRHLGSLLLALVCSGTVVYTHNRASMLGLAVAVALLALRGRPAFMAWLGGAGIAALLAVSTAVAAGWLKWQQTPVPAMLDLVASVVDVRGDARYRAEETEFKGDNNKFRAVWWANVIEETREDSLWTGLGFGHDLAARFLAAYYPVSTDDFTARSPHSIYVTVFARMGLIGLGLFLLILIFLGHTLWQNLHRFGIGPEVVPGLTALVLLTSGSLGVVLEGPMGAVVFWGAFGLSRAQLRASEKGHPRQPALDKARDLP